MADTPTPDPYEREVVLTLKRRYDVDIHLSKVQVDDEEYVDIREFIPSLGQYGRGILVPMRLASALGDGVLKMAEDWDLERGDG